MNSKNETNSRENEEWAKIFYVLVDKYKRYERPSRGPRVLLHEAIPALKWSCHLPRKRDGRGSKAYTLQDSGVVGNY